MIRYAIIVTFLAITITSCTKSGSGSPGGTTTTTGSGDVYIAGKEATAQGSKAVYWKNGKEVVITNGTSNASATCIYVSGSDVYVGGFDGYGEHIKAVYWKNNVEFDLDPYIGDTSAATSIAFYNNQVFATYNLTTFYGTSTYGYGYGRFGSVAFFAPFQTSANGIYAASDGNVYVGGSVQHVVGMEYGAQVQEPQPVYWINNNTVSDDLIYVHYGVVPNSGLVALGKINSVFASGSDVYSAGWQGGGQPADYHTFLTFPVYWKNLDPVVLATPVSGYANSIVVSGTDVYVAGVAYYAQEDQAVYWKNNVENVLPKVGNAGSFANGIAVSGNDVYVAGNDANTSNFVYRAVYWKNGTEVLLTDGTYPSAANGIFIVP